jgi:hypothetical protein
VGQACQVPSFDAFDGGHAQATVMSRLGRKRVTRAARGASRDVKRRTGPGEGALDLSRNEQGDNGDSEIAPI